MADGFRTALQRIGFNIPTSQKIVDEGFATIAALAEVSDDDIEALTNHIGRWRTDPPEGELPIALPFLSVRKMRAMRLWVTIQQRKG